MINNQKSICIKFIIKKIVTIFKNQGSIGKTMNYKILLP